MRFAVARGVGVLVVIVFVVCAGPAWGDSPESVVRRFFALAYDGRFDDLPKTADARTERFERQIRAVLRVRCIRAEGMAVSVLDSGEDRVTLHADVAIAKRDRLSSEDWSPIEMVPFRVALAREQATWQVTEIQNLDEEYAQTLLQSKGEDRERLLREAPDRVSKGLARALYARSLAHLNSGENREAAEASEMARRVAVEVGDRGGEALALGAACYTADPKTPGGAERLIQEALAIAQTVGDPDVVARIWYDRGRSLQMIRWQRDSSRSQAQMEAYRKARKLAERAEDPTILIRVLYSLANIAANRQSDYLNARRYIDEAMPIAREAGDVMGEMSLEMVLSTVYFEQGDFERGLFHHVRATEMAEKAQAFAYPTLMVRWGCLLVDQGRFDEARAMLARAVTRNETGVVPVFKSMPGNVMGSALRALALIEAHNGHFIEAECLNREAALHHLGSPETFLYELAPHYASRGDDAGALAVSLASLAQIGLHANQRVAALIAAGRADLRMGNLEAGLGAALEAIDIREAVDSRIAGDEQQKAFAASVTSECYELAAELTLAAGNATEALVFLERGRARVLTDTLENGRPASVAEIDAGVREQQSALDREIVRIRAEVERAQATGDRAVGDHIERLNHARTVRASFLDGVRARSERQSAVRRRIDASEILGIGTRLPPSTVALEYFVGERDLHIFVLSANGVIVRTKRVERTLLDQRVTTFLEMLASGDLRVEARGQELYSFLIAPIENDIAGADVLLVVPDDSLWRVPFAALVDRRGQFLVQRKAIFYAPSMTAYAAIVAARKPTRSRDVSLLAVANPTRDEAASKAAASFYRNTSLGPLPDAEHEVDALRALYDPRQSLVLKRDRATETRTKSALRGVSVAHFATHAILDDANPMYSRLMLARDGQAEEDGWLESWEVARLDLDADLVILSACETARGRVGGGEGVVGLSWSFFLAGASSTVATQWKVASDSTAQFMIAFHRSLRAPAVNPALHKAQAVREAQLHCIRDKRTRHPFHWAPFVLLGDPSVRTDK